VNKIFSSGFLKSNYICTVYKKRVCDTRYSYFLFYCFAVSGIACAVQNLHLHPTCYVCGTDVKYLNHVVNQSTRLICGQVRSYVIVKSDSEAASSHI